jgi:hypothetical protein
LKRGFHFFLYPAGHLGVKPVTFLVVFPFMQVIEDFLNAFGTTGFFASDN